MGIFRGSGALLSTGQLAGREGTKAVNSGEKTPITKNLGKTEQQLAGV